MKQVRVELYCFVEFSLTVRGAELNFFAMFLDKNMALILLTRKKAGLFADNKCAVNKGEN